MEAKSSASRAESAGHRSPRWTSDPWFVRVVLLIAAVKAVLLFTSWLSLQAMGEPTHPFASDGTLLFAWDSFNYARVLEAGYPLPGDQMGLIGFFPGYPLASYPLTLITTVPIALLVVSNIMSAIGYVLVYQWGKDLYGAKTAFLAVLVAIAYPPAFFASSAYSEGPFLLFVAWVMFLLGRQRFLAAALVAAVASFFRPTGVILGILVLVEIWRQGYLSWSVARARAIGVTLALGLLTQTGALAYEGYLTARYDDWLVYLSGQDQWTTIGERAQTRADPGDVGRADRDASQVASLVDEDGAERRDETRARHGMRERAGFVGRMRHRLASFGAWNKFLIVGVIAVMLAGVLRPGKIPRTLFIVPVVLLVLGCLPGMGARVTCLARFEVVALPCFLFVAVHLRERNRWMALLVAAMFMHQLLLAYAFTRGVWAG